MDVFWTSYACSIYALCPGGQLVACNNTDPTKLHRLVHRINLQGLIFKTAVLDLRDVFRPLDEAQKSLTTKAPFIFIEKIYRCSTESLTHLMPLISFFFKYIADSYFTLILFFAYSFHMVTVSLFRQKYLLKQYSTFTGKNYA